MGQDQNQPKTKFLDKISKYWWLMVIVFGIILVFTLKYNKQEKIEYKEIITVQKDTVFYYKDKYDIEHARVQTLEANMETLQFAFGSKIDSVSKELSITKNQIQSILEITSETIGKIKTPVQTKIVGADTVYDFEYDDKYIQILGSVGKDSADIDYRINDDLRVVGYQKRSGFLGLGRKQTFVDIKSNNPKTHIMNATSMKLSNVKDKRFSVGPSVGYYFNGSKWTPGIGVSLQYGLLRF